MKPTFLPLLCAAVLAMLFVTACDSSEEITPATIEPLSSADYLNLSYHPSVFFQYALHDAETDELQGFRD